MTLSRLRKNIFLLGSRVVATVIALIAFAVACDLANAEDPEIASRRASERHDFTNGEISEGFLKIALRAELQLGKPSERVRKFDEPIRIFVESDAQPDRKAEIAEVVADIRRRIDHLDLSITDDHDEANFLVSLVADREVAATIRTRYGSARASQIQKSLAPQCLSGIGKDRQYRVRRAEVILPVDAGNFTFYDCAYEEILQGLGAINDDSSVPWTMFNDDVQMGFFDIYDQYLLNILYDPRIRPGMTKSEVERLMPEVLASARTFVTSTNSLRHADRRDSQDSTTNRAATSSADNAQSN
jgi:hypothetical protein